MKLYFIYLTLLLIKFSFTSNVIYKRENDINWENYEDCNKISSNGCKEIMEEGYDKVKFCLDKINETCKISYMIDEYNIDDVCNNWQSSQCQNLICKNSKNIPECKSFSDSFSNALDEFLNSLRVLYNPICSRDENGNYCPMSTYFLDGNYEEQNAIDLINDNCNSINCRKIAVETYENILKNEEINLYNTDTREKYIIINSFFSNINNKKYIFKRQFKYNPTLDEKSQLKQIVEYLKSENCISQTKYINIASNAFSQEIKSSFIVIIIIISILLLNI